MSTTEVNLNLIFLMQVIQIFFFSGLFCIFARGFIDENSGHDYMFEGVESHGLYQVGIFISFWFIMMRYVPFDLILQTETGKIIYSKFIEWDLQMASVNPETKELDFCKV